VANPIEHSHHELTRHRPRKHRSPLALKVIPEPVATPPLIKILPTPLPDRIYTQASQHERSAVLATSFRRPDGSPGLKSRRRISAAKKYEGVANIPIDFPTPQTAQPLTLLTSCHICHKAPRLKKDLEAYENCWRCHERTCYICIRQCEAGCGSRKVCRQCCVEQGEEGVVYCLDCLEKTEDYEMEG
jgi:hypothetical protein